LAPGISSARASPFGVTAQPTAEWIANQLTAACGWEQIPRDLIRDRDACYGSLFVRRVRDHPISPRSPWQNGYAERLIGSIRRECLDHIVVTGEQHLRHVLKCYMEYYNVVRTHQSLGMRPFGGTSSAPGASKCGLCLVDCTISTCGFDLR
jgi:transposase InsO family protein